MADLILYGQFITNKRGKTGLTPTVNVYRTAISTGTKTQVVTAGATAEVGDGLYQYRLTGVDLAAYSYVANFYTADSTVDQQDIAAQAIVVPDALVSSRLAPVVAGRLLAVDADGIASAYVLNPTDITEDILARDWLALASEPASFSVINALRFLRNRWTANNGTLTVFAEDGATEAWTAQLTTNASADAVTGVTPTTEGGG